MTVPDDFRVPNPEDDPVLTPGEVAERLRVDVKTVTRWVNAGKLTAFKTIGGHRRYRESDLREALERVNREK